MKTKKIIEIVLVSFATISVVGLLTSKIVSSNLNNSNTDIQSSESSQSVQSTQKELANVPIPQVQYSAANTVAISRDTSLDWINNLSSPIENFTVDNDSLLSGGEYAFTRNDLSFTIGNEVKYVSYSEPSIITDHNEVIESCVFDGVKTQRIDYTTAIYDFPDNKGGWGYEQITTPENNVSPGGLIIISKDFANDINFTLNPLISSIHSSVSSQYTGLKIFHDSQYYYFYVTGQYDEWTVFVNCETHIKEQLTLNPDGVSYSFDTTIHKENIKNMVQFYQMSKINTGDLCYHSVLIPE